MNPRDTPHNYWCTVEKLQYLWISCFRAQNPIVQLMFMSLSIRENKLFSEHLRWSTTILTRISDGVTPYIFTRYKAPPTETDKKCFYIRQWYRLAEAPSFFSPWRGPYTILKGLNDVNYRIKEVSTGKESMLHYDRLKPFRRKPPTTNIPTRETTPEIVTSTSNVPTRNRTLRSSTPRNDIDHTYYTEWPSLPTPQQFSPSIAKTFSGSNLPIPCPTPAIATPPMGTVTVPHTPASTVPYAQNSEQSTTITPTSTSTTKNRTNILSSSPVSQRLSNKTFSPSTPTSRPGGRSRKRKIIDQATAKLRVASQTPQEHRTLRASTMQQRPAQPLFMSNLPTNLTDFNSPNRSGKTQPQRWTKRFDELLYCFFLHKLAFIYLLFSLLSRISAQFLHVVVVSGFLKNPNESLQ